MGIADQQVYSSSRFIMCPEAVFSAVDRPSPFQRLLLCSVGADPGCSLLK